MKYFVITTSGYIVSGDKKEAIKIFNTTENSIEIVKSKKEETIYNNNRIVILK